MSILPFLKDEAAFDPNDVRSMSMAFDDVCEVLKISEAETQRREVVAARIIEIARRGEHSLTLLRDRVLKEAGVTLSENHRAAGPIPLSHYSEPSILRWRRQWQWSWRRSAERCRSTTTRLHEKQSPFGL